MAGERGVHERWQSSPVEVGAQKPPPTALDGPAILVLLITILAFLPALGNGFFEWDGKMLMHNASRGWHWSEVAAGPYRPIPWLTFRLDYFLWGMDPFGFHLTNLVLHSMTSIALYLVGLRLFSSDQLASLASDTNARKVAAGFSALIFSLHPLRVEPVALAAARPNLLCGFFFLVAILSYLNASQSGGHKRRRLWLTACAGAFALSLLSSIQGIALPLVLLLLDIYPLKKLGSRTQKWSDRVSQRLLGQKLLWLVVGFMILLPRLALSPANESPPADRPEFESVLTYLLVAPIFYLWKSIVPLRFSPYYEFPLWFVALAALGLAAISATLLSLKERLPGLLAIWTCYLMVLLPGAVGDGSGLPLMADRNGYLPSMPLAILAGSGYLVCRKIIANRRLAPWSWAIPAGLAGSMLFGLALLSWNLTQAWRDTETLWRNAAGAGHSSAAHFKLAALLEDQEKDQEAIAHYQQAAAMDPLRWEAHERAGLLLHKQSDLQASVRHLRQALAVNPNAIEARDKLATALVTTGAVVEATQQFRKLLEISPGLNDARLKLATILALQGQLDEAVSLFEQALKKDPDDANIHSRLGEILAAQGKLVQAVGAFKTALRLRPNDPEIHEKLGRGLVELGKKDEAAAHLREALKILRSTPAER